MGFYGILWDFMEFYGILWDFLGFFRKSDCLEVIFPLGFQISRYTESNFKKEGIEVITSAFVSRLEGGTIHYKNAVTKEQHSMPYGMCVWCAGIGPREITKQIQKELPEQNNRWAL